MPYNISTEHPDCAGFAVVKTETNDLMGCHETEAEAQAQLTALNIAESEERSIDVTAGMRRSAERGIAYYEDGRAGDGLQPETVAEARDIARGEISEDKVVRMRAWIARHRGDWEGNPANNDPSDDRFPGPGAVAAFLWAVNPTDSDDADRVIAWCERYLSTEDDEDEDEETSRAMNTPKKTAGIEFRAHAASPLTVREDGRTFTGYVALFDSPSDGLGFTEVIKPTAFNRSLSRAERGEANIVALFGHDPMEFLGSTAAGNLRLRTDNRGLVAELSLPNTQRGNDLAALFDAGESVSMGMSFGFMIPGKNAERWSEDGTTRELHEVKLVEVSLLSGGQDPAYPATIGLGSVRALAGRLGVELEEARDAVDGLLAGDLTANRTAILARAIGASALPAAEPVEEAPAVEPVEEAPAAPAAEEAPVAEEPAAPAINNEKADEPRAVPASTLHYLALIKAREVKN